MPNYIFESDLGSNHKGDVVTLEEQSAVTLLAAGIVKEAGEDMYPMEEEDEPEEKLPAPMHEEAVTRAIRQGFKQIEDNMVNVRQKGTATTKVNLGNFATPKQPAIKSIGELCRVQYFAKQGSHNAYNRLQAYADEVRTKAPPIGSNETTPAQGGFSIVPDWSEDLFYKVKQYPRLLDYCRRETISSNTLNIPAIAEGTLQDGGRGGGILNYWVAEGGTATTSYPQMANIQCVLGTNVVIVPITNQLLEDNSYNLDNFIADRVGEEMVWAEDYAVISGPSTGTGGKGIMNQPSLVTIAKETGQANASLVYPNLVKMWAALYPASRPNAVWLANPQCVQQLQQMAFPNATGTFSVFGMVTYSAHDEFPLRVFGKPVIETLMSPDLGLPGDLILCDLKQMYAAEHPGMSVATSDQVYFTSLQTLFRFVRRYDLNSPWTTKLTDFNNHYQYSPFIALASRGT